MIKKDRLTIVVQPDWRSSTKKVNRTTTFEFPRRIVFFAALGIVLLVNFGISGSRAISKNILLKNKLISIQGSLGQLKGVEAQFKNMRKEESIIRAFLGIESSGKNIDIYDRMGQGGTEPTNDISPISFNAKQELQELDPNRPLHLQVNDLRENVHGLMSALSKMTKKLTCRPTIMPVKDDDIWITSGFGWRKSPFTGLREFHKGLDISGKKGVPVIATADGVVEGVGYDRFLGNYVDLSHDARFSTYFGHLNNSVVKEGQKVVRGQVVGYMGTTGVSTGNHLHYEISDNQRKVNPYNFILNRAEITLAANLNE